MCRSLAGSGISINELFGQTQSLMCHRDRHGKAQVETPDSKTKECYKPMGIEVPSMVRIEQFKRVWCVGDGRNVVLFLPSFLG